VTDAFVTWFRRQDNRLLIAAAGVLFLAIAFVVLGAEVNEEDTTAFDNQILLAFRDEGGIPIGPTWLVQVIADLSALGSAVIATAVVIIATAFLALSHRPRHAIMMALCGMGAPAVMEVLKQFHERPRPSVIIPVDPTIGLSFPSGHTLAATAIYLTLGVLIASAADQRRIKIFVMAIAVLLAFVVGFTRVYLGAHYPTDVVGGWMVGLAWALFCGGIARLLGLRQVARDVVPSTT
jgi:undecaprenyl-diphosphatase